MAAQCFVDIIRQRSWSISVICNKDVKVSAVQNIIFVSTVNGCTVIAKQSYVFIAQIAMSQVFNQMCFSFACTSFSFDVSIWYNTSVKISLQEFEQRLGIF